MDSKTILIKTPRGREEIRTRAHGLGAFARHLLIIADGTHTVRDLAADLAMRPDDPELQASLEGLVGDQYLHVADGRERMPGQPPENTGWHAVRR